MNSVLAVNTNDYVVVANNAEANIVAAAIQGPTGTSGGGSGSGGNTITMIANGPIGGGRVVISNGDGTVSYANPLANNYGVVVGVTQGAANGGDPIVIQVSGDLSDSSWTWTPGYLFTGANGVLTSTVPTTGILQIIATVLQSTKINIDIKQPIKLI
jgi:hypothetical protein